MKPIIQSVLSPQYAGLLLAALVLPASAGARMETTVLHGTLTRPSSHSALFMAPDDVLYAINNSGDTAPQRVIDGVTFDSNRLYIPGYLDANIPGRLNDWDADTATRGPDHAAMNQVLNDIDCCGAPMTYRFAVPNGLTRLQLFWQGDNESRVWDIEVEGAVSVDEVTSNGYWAGGALPRDNNMLYTLFEQIVNVTDGELNVRIGQFRDDGNQLNADRFVLLSGMVVSIADPSTLRIGRSGEDVIVSWPASVGAGWTLEASESGSGDYSNDGLPAPALVGERYQVTVEMTDTARCFRLAHWPGGSGW